MLEEHWHGSTSQNNRFTENRCFRDDLASAQEWTTAEIVAQQNVWAMGLVSEVGADSIESQFREMAAECQEYDGNSEAWEGSATVDGTEYGYRIMSIDGMCEDML